MTKRKRIDWDAIKPMYCLGTLSNREVSAQYGLDHKNSQTWSRTVSEGAIRLRAKNKKWQRDIAGKVQNRVRENLLRTGLRTAQNMTEEELIEAAAEKPVAVRLLQRGRAQTLAQTGDTLQGKLDQELSIESTPDVTKNSNQDSEDEDEVKPLSLYALVSIYVKLVTARSKLQEMESDAFGLNDDTDAGPKRIKVTHSKEDD